MALWTTPRKSGDGSPSCAWLIHVAGHVRCAWLMGRSKNWVCPTCGVKNHELLSDTVAHPASAPIATASEPADVPAAPLITEEGGRPGNAVPTASSSRDEDRRPHASTSASAAPALPESPTRPTAVIPTPSTTLPPHVAHVPPIPAATLTQRYIPAGNRPEPARDARPAQQAQAAAPVPSVANPAARLPSYQSVRQLIDLSILFLVFILLGMLVRRIV